MFDRVLKGLYDHLLRPYLPRKVAVFNGVPVRQPRLLDRTDVRPEYESALVAAIREVVTRGDDVVVVGGGWGVSTVVAARMAGSAGSVRTYEAAADQVEHVRETVELNRVADWVEVVHAAVGDPRRPYGSLDEAATVPPDELPGCDVLVLDCEGAERSILDGLGVRPGTVVVETHPMFDAPAAAVRERLSVLGYDVVDERIEETPYGELPVLTARST